MEFKPKFEKGPSKNALDMDIGKTARDIINTESSIKIEESSLRNMNSSRGKIDQMKALAMKSVKGHIKENMEKLSEFQDKYTKNIDLRIDLDENIELVISDYEENLKQHKIILGNIAKDKPRDKKIAQKRIDEVKFTIDFLRKKMEEDKSIDEDSVEKKAA